MRQARQFYIDGKWTDPDTAVEFDVINPATEQKAGTIHLGSVVDVDRAVAAASRAFPSFARTSRAERLELFDNIIEEYRKRRPELAEAITAEMGAPKTLADKLHGFMGHVHLRTAQSVLKTFEFEEIRKGTRVMLEPIGVCGLITPWNWPVNQIAAKVAPALACGCTVVLKPSEMSPFSAQIWAEVMHAAGVPAGVFNMVYGTGLGVGRAISAHKDIAMISFTGSTQAGIDVARTAADTIKRVHQELGGKSANIIMPDADFENAVRQGLKTLMNNSGQSCNAPTRMLVPHDRMAQAHEILADAARGVTVGDPLGDPDIGPVISRIQYDKIQALISQGINDGGKLAAGGLGRPDGLDAGYFIRPTVFTHVTNDMTIAREEIFGPVLCVIGYEDLDEAVAIANDSDFGLAAYIQGKDPVAIAKMVEELRVGQINVNNANPDAMAPFGGYKQSGNGREWGDHAFEAFLEIKAVLAAAS
jgi:aldehyde dehydrogenase (NAD+)